MATRHDKRRALGVSLQQQHTRRLVCATADSLGIHFVMCSHPAALPWPAVRGAMDARSSSMAAAACNMPPNCPSPPSDAHLQPFMAKPAPFALCDLHLLDAPLLTVDLEILTCSSLKLVDGQLCCTSISPV
ncbi:hypothetical protein J1614_004437 [Plenodomus biglobosus]|nr:hypothetical protein J1614_004437 [Plenodomus biglobosus]